MASIGKTYIFGNEYPLYREWWIQNHEKMKKEMGEAIYLYPFGYFFKTGFEITPEYLLENQNDLVGTKNLVEISIWNTSERWDKWLVKNCEIRSFRDRMLYVYGHKWSGFKGCKWVLKKDVKQTFKNKKV